MYDVMKKKKKKRLITCNRIFFVIPNQAVQFVILKIQNVSNIENIGTQLKTMVALKLCPNTHILYCMFTKDYHFISL